MTGLSYDSNSLARAVMTEAPELGRQLNERIKQYQQQSLEDVELINSVFFFFCQHQGINASEIREVNTRSTEQIISFRRLFIAVTLKMYDPLFLHEWRGRMKDNLRLNISHVLNCHEIWISNVVHSVRHEIKNLKGYDKETDGIITLIRANLGSAPTDIPKFINVRSRQASLFE